MTIPTGQPAPPSMKPAPDPAKTARIVAELGQRCIVLVGMMGAGKTSVGRRLAARLHLPFVDADQEIEAAANKTIAEIFAEHGEPYFRAGEKRVIARLLKEGPQVIATGGGAYMDPETRENIAAYGICVWLKAEPALLIERVKRRAHRPLLQTGNVEETVHRLVEARYPVYALAEITVTSRNAPHEAVVDDVLQALDRFVEHGQETQHE